MKQFIKFNKKTILISIILLIITNLLTNHNYILSLFNKTKPITYTKENITKIYNSYEITNINKEINLIEINFETIPSNITVRYTSNDFKNYNHFNSNYSSDYIKSTTMYIPASINGKLNNLKIDIGNGQIKSITLNPKVKFNLNIPLNIIITLLSFFINYIIKKNDKINSKNNNQIYAIIVVFSIIISICTNYYLTYTKHYYSFGDLYEYYYTNSIKNGKLNLDIPIYDELKKADNPYDTSNRTFNYFWDASYYKGKYYCYFGLWPIISLFIPYNIITNSYLTTPLACLIYAILSIIGTFKLYNEIIKKYFNKINFQTYIISFIFIIFGSKILWCMHRPSFYELVSLAAYTHTTFGLNYVLFSDKKIKNLIGYFLLALSVLCRPTSLFCSILIIPKILNRIKNKNFKLLDFILLTIPYAIVGIFTMYINYIRFDSIFEFGVSYQLTTNNLSNYKFSIINSIYGLYNYLFGKINIHIFPLRITGITNRLPIVTDFNIENIGGGTITTSILGIIILFIPKIFKYIKEKEVKIYIILSLTLGTFLILFSSGIGALIGRYMLDFNYLFYFIIVILSLYTLNTFKNKHLITIYKILTIISIFINFMLSRTN